MCMARRLNLQLSLHYFHENEDGLKKTVAMIPAIGGLHPHEARRGRI